jgi:hypothetical protein
MSYIKLGILVFLLTISFLLNVPDKEVNAEIEHTIKDEEITPSSKEYVPVYEKESYSKEEILSMIDFYADKYGVSRELAHYVAKNESGYNSKAIGDLTLICNAPRSPYHGEIVYARGIYQITRCFHYNVTDKQAFDAKFNIEYGIKLMQTKAMCMSQFTECKNYYAQKTS